MLKDASQMLKDALQMLYRCFTDAQDAGRFSLRDILWRLESISRQCMEGGGEGEGGGGGGEGGERIVQDSPAAFPSGLFRDSPKLARNTAQLVTSETRVEVGDFDSFISREAAQEAVEEEKEPEEVSSHNGRNQLIRR